MSNSPGSVPANLNGDGIRVGVVQARFNEEITNGLWKVCCAELLRLGVQSEDVLHITVPGAMEIPVTLDRLALSGEFDVLIALGAIIKGDTYHFEIVSNESARGVSDVALRHNLPIINMILTTYTEDQAIERIEDKGVDAARGAVEMGNLMMAMDDNLPLEDELEEEDDE
ncbi:MAG TPA: 6,7-dimethyl-8-ribityllumazine synthase [Limnobacter sp.]|uniref:6,7-dimethyl-8-ribityllumazine synthase n=1 Tax=Limnobacter sp. TaxID=2003368 RepID=UPI002E369559|nr:6,7-dimethyl-8-ribityllumazine synthase [Limnobacter sp.]HEX5485878.1 6,7-dimethyl-8-ribityllumazine synthase [Limnobacter sp.]